MPGRATQRQNLPHSDCPATPILTEWRTFHPVAGASARAITRTWRDPLPISLHGEPPCCPRPSRAPCVSLLRSPFARRPRGTAYRTAAARTNHRAHAAAVRVWSARWRIIRTFPLRFTHGHALNDPGAASALPSASTGPSARRPTECDTTLSPAPLQSPTMAQQPSHTHITSSWSWRGCG